MAIISCPECGKSVSDQSEKCIHCGYPLIDPLEKLVPKMNQLWEAEQYQECLNACNDILLVNPKDYNAILRLELCRLVIEDDLKIGLDGYQRAVKAFEETADVSTEEADTFACSIRFLFMFLITNHNKLIELRSSLDEMNGQVFRYQMAAPIGSKTSMAASMMYNDAKNRIQEFEEYVTPHIKKWTKVVYCEFPQKLSSISKEGKEVYDWIAKNALIMNPDMKSTIEIRHPQIVREREEQLAQNASSGGCYIATCVYGSYDCPPVWTLRRFRDEVLAQNNLGRLFIKTYYFISPKLVEKFGDSIFFKSIWQWLLDKLVLKLRKSGFSSEAYRDL